MSKEGLDLMWRVQAAFGHGHRSGGTSPALSTDPRARECSGCGRLLYPEEVCGCAAPPRTARKAKP